MLDKIKYSDVRCDWCYEWKPGWRVNKDAVWIMSVCQECWDMDSKEMGYANV